MAIGIATETVLAVSFSGDPAYEIYVPNENLNTAYAALRWAGEAHDLRLFGSRAVEPMRMEKGVLHWKADILTEFDPFETGMDRSVEFDNPEFTGKEALGKRIQDGPKCRLVTLEIDAPRLLDMAGRRFERKVQSSAVVPRGCV